MFNGTTDKRVETTEVKSVLVIDEELKYEWLDRSTFKFIVLLYYITTLEKLKLTEAEQNSS